MDRTYVAIDLKSFYASAECAALHVDPLNTHLVVADVSRTEKTICLAVSPSLKSYGLPGRARLFEVVRKMGEVNERRRLAAPGRRFIGESCDARELSADPALKAAYIIAKPRMATYIRQSSRIYAIYLKYAAPEDIHVYSIDEVFIDVTRYLRLYRTTAHELSRAIISDILSQTGITATAGIGTNLYLAKVAGYRRQAHPGRAGRGARRRTRRGVVPAPAVESSATHRLLAGRARVCEEAGGARAADHGRHRALLRGRPRRLLQ